MEEHKLIVCGTQSDAELLTLLSETYHKAVHRNLIQPIPQLDQLVSKPSPDSPSLPSDVVPIGFETIIPSDDILAHIFRLMHPCDPDVLPRPAPLEYPRERKLGKYHGHTPFELYALMRVCRRWGRVLASMGHLRVDFASRLVAADEDTPILDILQPLLARLGGASCVDSVTLPTLQYHALWSIKISALPPLTSRQSVYTHTTCFEKKLIMINKENLPSVCSDSTDLAEIARTYPRLRRLEWKPPVFTDQRAALPHLQILSVPADAVPILLGLDAPRLIRLEITGARRSDYCSPPTGTVDPAALLQRFPHLRSLRLHKLDGVASLRGCAPSPSLRSLLVENRPSEETLAALASVFPNVEKLCAHSKLPADVRRHFPRLATINGKIWSHPDAGKQISLDTLSPTVTHLEIPSIPRGPLPRLPRITKLSVGKLRGEEELRHLLEAFPGLRSLRIASMHNWTDAQTRLLCEALGAALERFYLHSRYPRITDTSLDYLATHCPYMTHLDISNPLWITGEGVNRHLTRMRHLESVSLCTGDRRYAWEFFDVGHLSSEVKGVLENLDDH